MIIIREVSFDVALSTAATGHFRASIVVSIFRKQHITTILLAFIIKQHITPSILPAFIINDYILRKGLYCTLCVHYLQITL